MGHIGTHARMLEAAIRVIDGAGEEAVHVRDIAAEAGVTYASLYHFFGDREGLIEEAQVERYERSLLETVEPLTEAIARCRTREEFRAVARGALKRVFQADRIPHRRTRVSVLGSAMSRPALAERLAVAQRNHHRTLAEALRMPQEKGWVRPGLDLVMLSAWILGQTNGRLLIEMDPGGSDATAWDQISIDAVLAVVMGECPGGTREY